MEYILENEKLKIEISTLGAELQSIKNKKMCREYLWNGNKEFWGRRAPVLFPFVGSLKNKEFEYKGKKYPMSQHGFARDMEFDFIEKKENEIWFNLKSNKITLEKYPFEFSLDIGYKLINNKLEIIWKVKNIGSKKMYFSIGAHPAFLVPIEKNEKREDYFIKFDTNKELTNTGLEGGLVNKNNIKNGKIKLDEGYLKINSELFKYDALIIENNQAQKVSLCRPDKSEYITVSFDAPLFGLWSPYKPNSPFVCIEPWFGRADSKDFEGNIEDREWQNELNEDEEFIKKYKIEFN